LTFDIKVPATLINESVIFGGQYQDAKYGDFQAEWIFLTGHFVRLCWKVTPRAGFLLSQFQR
jgi:hypothetical protein